MQESKNSSTKKSSPSEPRTKIIFSPLVLYILLSLITLIILVILLIFLFRKIFKQPTKKRDHLDGTVSKSDFKVNNAPISNALKPTNNEKVTQPPLTDKSSNMIKLVDQKSTKNETTNHANITNNNNPEFEISNTFNSEAYSENTENNNENIKDDIVIIADE